MRCVQGVQIIGQLNNLFFTVLNFSVSEHVDSMCERVYRGHKTRLHGEVQDVPSCWSNY